MKIKHNIEIEDTDVETLYAILATPATQTYGSIALQTEALVTARPVFAEAVDKLVQKAFKLGYNVGRAKADTKDMEMYS